MFDETTRIDIEAGPLPLNYIARSRTLKFEKTDDSFHCLVVDANRRNLHLVTQMIQALGHQADTAENGDLAFSKFASNGHNVVVADLDMPNTDGFALAVKVKKMFSDAKTVVMTGRCQAEVFDKMSAGVVDAWLFKPFSIDELFKALNTLKSA